jgi:2-dehydro-3-deoxygluconokinase
MGRNILAFPLFAGKPCGGYTVKIIGFGDYLIHFSPFGNERFAQADFMRMSFTGAEANVCAALSLWGEDVSFVTRVPTNALAEKGMMFLRSLGIDTRHIARGGKRMGLYFLENGASVRPSQVIYDRADSGFTEARAEDFDIPSILNGADAFYVTGITPALSENLKTCALAFCREARARGVDVVFDVNFRPTLLTALEAGENLRLFAPYITHLIGNEEHLKMLLGVHSQFGEDSRDERLFDLAGQTSALLGISNVAVTVRRTLSASDAVTYAAFLSGERFAVSPEYRTHVVDRVGSGDAFSAGVLYGVARGFSVSDTVGFAAASCAIKHTVSNDVNFACADEIERLMKNGSSDVRR